MATIRLFASARDAAGTGTDVLDGATVAEVLAAAERRYGQRFSDVSGHVPHLGERRHRSPRHPSGPT